MKCFHCGSTNLVTCYSDGDITCRSCGTVNESNMIVDDAYSNMVFNDDDNCEAHWDKIETITLDKIQSQFKDCFKLFDFPTSIEESSQKILQEIRSKQVFRGDCLKGMMAVSIYVACIGQGKTGISRAAEEIHRPLGIDSNTFNKALKVFLEMFPNRINALTEEDSLRRQIQRSLCLDSKKEWDVVKKVRMLDIIRKDNRMLMGSPPKVVNAVLIYVACQQLGIKIDKNHYIAEANISRATLDKHAKTFSKLISK